jgi:hypothetical protein
VVACKRLAIEPGMGYQAVRLDKELERANTSFSIAPSAGFRGFFRQARRGRNALERVGGVCATLTTGASELFEWSTSSLNPPNEIASERCMF